MFKLAELFVSITGNAAPLNATLAGVHSKLMGFGAAGAQAGGMLAHGIAGGMGASLGAIGLGVAGVTSLGVALGASARMASQFETRMNLLGRLTNASAEELGRMEGDLRELATSADLAGVTLEQLSEAAIMGGRMGIPIGEMKDFAKTAAEVAIALDDIPVETAVQGIAQILGVYGKGVDEARNFAGALDALSNNAKATGGEILDVANRLKSSASNLGMSPQDLLALSTAMKDVGLRTEMAGTNMGVILSKMASDTSRFAKVAGMDVKEFERTLDAGPLEALKAFIGGLQGGRADLGLLAELGITGERTKTIVMSLSQSMDRLTDYQKMSNAEWETMAYFNRDVSAATQSSSAQMQRSWNRVKDVLISLGERVLPLVSDGLDFVADAVEGVSYVVTTMRGTIAQQMADFEGYDGLIKGFGSTWTYLKETIADWWDLAKFAFNNFTTVLGVVDLQVQQFGINVGEAIDWVGDTLWSFATWAAFNWRELIADALDSVWTIFQNLGENIKNLWSAVMGWLAGDEWSFEFTGLLDGFEATVGKLPEIARPAFTSLQGEIDALLEGAYSKVQEATDKAREAAEELSGEAEEKRAGRTGSAEGGQTTDLAGFARELQQAALSGGIEQKQLDEQIKTRTLFEQYKAMQQQHNERQQRAFERMMARMGAV